MENFNALLTLSELKTLYSGKPVGICPLYKGVLSTTKTFEATGNPITIPEYKRLVKLKTEFSPKQAGAGDPSPENVRPISGWDSVKVTVSNESASHDYNLTLPETIYGGTVDAVVGEGEKTWEIVEFDGTESFLFQTYENGVTISYRLGDKANIVEIDKSFCSHCDYGISALGCFWIDSSGSFLRFLMDGFSTVDEWKSYLAAQAAAGTPVQVAYKLATPEPFEISQTSIPSLKSKNTFFTNGENMDIIYNETSFWG